MTPKLPADATLPAPVTDAERAGFTSFLGYVAELFDVAVENEGRAALARRGC